MEDRDMDLNWGHCLCCFKCCHIRLILEGWWCPWMPDHNLTERGHAYVRCSMFKLNKTDRHGVIRDAFAIRIKVKNYSVML